MQLPVFNSSDTPIDGKNPQQQEEFQVLVQMELGMAKAPADQTEPEAVGIDQEGAATTTGTAT